MFEFQASSTVRILLILIPSGSFHVLVFLKFVDGIIQSKLAAAESRVAARSAPGLGWRASLLQPKVAARSASSNQEGRD
jgi:hypothetical protein